MSKQCPVSKTVRQSAVRGVTAALLSFAGCSLLPLQAHAANNAWSVVPYLGLSQLGDQSPSLVDTESSELNVAVDSGFTAGLGLRYDYMNSRWSSEFAWEYRSNDISSTTADGSTLPEGNYASNIFYLNGRYALTEAKRWTPWVGGGLSWIQEIDLDSEGADSERSFSDSGSVGFQIMAGVDYDISERIYLSSELRYSSQSDLELKEEGGTGRISDIDYEPITLGLGIGFRF